MKKLEGRRLASVDDLPGCERALGEFHELLDFRTAMSIGTTSLLEETGLNSLTWSVPRRTRLWIRGRRKSRADARSWWMSLGKVVALSFVTVRSEVEFRYSCARKDRCEPNHQLMGRALIFLALFFLFNLNTDYNAALKSILGRGNFGTPTGWHSHLVRAAEKTQGGHPAASLGSSNGCGTLGCLDREIGGQRGRLGVEQLSTPLSTSYRVHPHTINPPLATLNN